MAAMEGATSIHIKFSGLAGETLDALRGPQSYNNLENLDPVFKDVLEHHKSEDGWILIDFRPLRDLRVGKLNPDLQDLIFNFDLWVLVPSTTAQTPINR